jgi:CRP-like cAMP-binding protein
VDSARLIGAVEDMELQAGVVIVAEGTSGDQALYMLEHGRVEVSIATATGEQSLAQLEAPSYFGEIAMLLARRTASVLQLPWPAWSATTCSAVSSSLAWS